MADKLVHFNFKFMKFDVTMKQLVLFILGVALIAWLSFTVAFTVNTQFFSCNVKPVKIETDKVKIGTTQQQTKDGRKSK